MLMHLSRQSGAQLWLWHKSFQAAGGSYSGVWMEKGACFPNQENSPPRRSFRTTIATSKESTLIEKLRKEIDFSVFKNIDFKELKSAPLPAVVYGFGGIIPFVFPPLYFVVGSYSSFLATSQLFYGASILAFIGGVKWGNALAKDDISHHQIGMSTIPSLVAWSSLLVPEPLGFLIVSSGLLGALYVDLVSSKYPPWFRAMRSTLTGIAVGSLITTLFCHLLH